MKRGGHLTTGLEEICKNKSKRRRKKEKSEIERVVQYRDSGMFTMLARRRVTAIKRPYSSRASLDHFSDIVRSPIYVAN